jgi:hypothetical protein
MHSLTPELTAVARVPTRVIVFPLMDWITPTDEPAYEVPTFHPTRTPKAAGSALKVIVFDPTAESALTDKATGQCAAWSAVTIEAGTGQTASKLLVAIAFAADVPVPVVLPVATTPVAPAPPAPTL